MGSVCTGMYGVVSRTNITVDSARKGWIKSGLLHLLYHFEYLITWKQVITQEHISPHLYKVSAEYIVSPPASRLLIND